MVTTVVTGIGRCGLTLTMQMLDAGGFPVWGEYPAYEPVMFTEPLGLVFMAAKAKAVKVVDPKNWHWPPRKGFTIQAILLERDPTEQAKSQIKLLQAMSPQLMASLDHVPKLAASNACDAEANRCRIGQYAKAGLLRMRFEDVIADPRAAAWKMSDFLDYALDIDAAVKQVRPRGPDCLDRMLEVELMERDGVLR